MAIDKIVQNDGNPEILRIKRSNCTFYSHGDLGSWITRRLPSIKLNKLIGITDDLHRYSKGYDQDYYIVFSTRHHLNATLLNAYSRFEPDRITLTLSAPYREKKTNITPFGNQTLLPIAGVNIEYIPRKFIKELGINVLEYYNDIDPTWYVYEYSKHKHLQVWVPKSYKFPLIYQMDNIFVVNIEVGWLTADNTLDIINYIVNTYIKNIVS